MQQQMTRLTLRFPTKNLTLNGPSASGIPAAFRSGSGNESPARSVPLIIRVFFHKARLELGADLRGAIDAHAH